MSLNQILENTVKSLDVKFNNVDLSTVNGAVYPPNPSSGSFRTAYDITGALIDGGLNTKFVSADLGSIVIEDKENITIQGVEYTTTRIMCSSIRVDVADILTAPVNSYELYITLPSIWKENSEFLYYSTSNAGVANFGNTFPSSVNTLGYPLEDDPTKFGFTYSMGSDVVIGSYVEGTTYYPRFDVLIINPV